MIEKSPKYEYWYSQYMLNGVNLLTLEKLVKADKLTKEELEQMKLDRFEKYGY